jgi:hypothetical protein
MSADPQDEGDSVGSGLRARLRATLGRLLDRKAAAEGTALETAREAVSRAAARISDKEQAWKREFARVARTVEDASSRAAPGEAPPVVRFDLLYESLRREMGAAARAGATGAPPLVGWRRRRALGRARARLRELERHLTGVEERAAAAGRDAEASWARAEAAVRAGSDEKARQAIFQARAEESMAKILSGEAAEGRAACRELGAILDEAERAACSGKG